jgi:hypothetical protein
MFKSCLKVNENRPGNVTAECKDGGFGCLDIKTLVNFRDQGKTG